MPISDVTCCPITEPKWKKKQFFFSQMPLCYPITRLLETFSPIQIRKVWNTESFSPTTNHFWNTFFYFLFCFFWETCFLGKVVVTSHFSISYLISMESLLFKNIAHEIGFTNTKTWLWSHNCHWNYSTFWESSQILLTQNIPQYHLSIILWVPYCHIIA